jgi:hypothetical protein
MLTLFLMLLLVMALGSEEVVLDLEEVLIAE